MQTEIIFGPLHTIILLFILWNIFKADKFALSWMRGKIEILDALKIKKLHDYILYGLLGMTVTGFGLFWPLREKLLASNAFGIKLALVVLLFLNSFFIERFMKIASEKKYSELLAKEKLPLIISGAVSTLAWISVLIAVAFLPD